MNPDGLGAAYVDGHEFDAFIGRARAYRCQECHALFAHERHLAAHLDDHHRNGRWHTLPPKATRQEMIADLQAILDETA